MGVITLEWHDDMHRVVLSSDMLTEYLFLHEMDLGLEVQNQVALTAQLNSKVHEGDSHDIEKNHDDQQYSDRPFEVAIAVINGIPCGIVVLFLNYIGFFGHVEHHWMGIY